MKYFVQVKPYDSKGYLNVDRDDKDTYLSDNEPWSDVKTKFTTGQALKYLRKYAKENTLTIDRVKFIPVND